MHSYLLKAIKNNALWCDLITKGHEKVGTFEDELWCNTNEVPLFYPNIITLNQDFGEAQKAIFDAISRIHPKDNWAVKDSYGTLKLESDGFFELFESHWFYRNAELDLPSVKAKKPQIVIIKTESDLNRWEKAWSEHQPLVPDGVRMFPKSLLNRHDVVILASIQDNKIINGLIANKTEDVIGISNLFGLALFEPEKMVPLLELVWVLLGRLSFVGYESFEDIERAAEWGVEGTGKLKVWMKS